MARLRTGDWSGSVSAAWADHAGEWIAWARAPGHDSYWQFHRDRFLELLPPPPGLVLDLGCGEGRLSRDLRALGFEVIGTDYSMELVTAARAADQAGTYVQADAAHLPFQDASFDLVVAFMSLQDMDQMDLAVAETTRVLRPGGRVCLAVVHPINSTGAHESEAAQAAFRIENSYMAQRDYFDEMERDGLTMTFVSRHRPLQDYTNAFTDRGCLIEALREVVVPVELVAHYPGQERWRRIPMFLQMRCLLPARR
ncbi:MAG: class I SAM-dependent methyltransferase [Candidatus Dormibacteria bacterium]